MTPGSARLRWALLGVVIAVSSGLVWTAFNPAAHTGGDNAGYITLAYSLLKNGTYTELFDPAQPLHTKYPPVFPALLAGLMALGARSWTSLKAVAVLSTVGASALTYLWAERRVGPGQPDANEGRAGRRRLGPQRVQGVHLRIQQGGLLGRHGRDGPGCAFHPCGWRRFCSPLQPDSEGYCRARQT